LENHSRLIVKTIPGQREKPFAFPPESSCTFSPESAAEFVDIPKRSSAWLPE
jgi:hypothetical protein